MNTVINTVIDTVIDTVINIVIDTVIIDTLFIYKYTILFIKYTILFDLIYNNKNYNFIIIYMYYILSL